MAFATYRFGEFRLDPARHELWRGDEELTLPLKVFDCIVHLVENRDRTIGRDELIEALWGDVHLTDSALGQVIRQARQALGDSGDDQHVIQTVRGFGYRWAAPVETPEPPATAAAAAATDARSHPRPIGHWVVLAILVIGVLVAVTLYLRQRADPGTAEGSASPRAEGEIALLLPVTVEADSDSDHAWVRLGLMDLIAERLRDAGQAMVPSDTVIALLRGVGSEPDREELDRLMTTTGAHLVLAARAQVTGTRWTVSLHSPQGSQPPVTAVGEAHDVLEAGRAAADRMARTLGLTPTPEPDTAPGLERLLQQIEAARLAQQMDVARALIEEAEPNLREHSEIRFQWGRVEFYSHHLDAARSTFETLLEEMPAERDPVLRARVLNGLAAVHAMQDNWGTAAESLEAASQLADGRDAPVTRGAIEMNLAGVALQRGDFPAVREHEAQARRIFQGIGDVQRLAEVDRNVGVLESRRERHAEALRYYESAAERYAAVQDVGGELRAHANMIEAHLKLLDPQAASVLEPRLQELLAQTTNAELVAIASINRAHLLDTRGRFRAADDLLDGVLSAAETGDIPPVYRLAALLLLAEREMTEGGDLPRAADLATEVAEGLASHPGLDEERARAWLVLVRAYLALGRPAAAAEASSAMTAWAETREPQAPRIYAVLAEAEVAAAEGRREAAETAFERALALADAGHVPLHLLHVAQHYVPWLLGEGGQGVPAPERALALAGRVAGYADQQYEAALLQLRVYHALGPPSTWRAALAGVSSLAGERQIPPALLSPPRPEQPVHHAPVT